MIELAKKLLAFIFGTFKEPKVNPKELIEDTWTVVEKELIEIELAKTVEAMKNEFVKIGFTTSATKVLVITVLAKVLHRDIFVTLSVLTRIVLI